MADRSFLSWPFFEDRHRIMAEKLEYRLKSGLLPEHRTDLDQTCRDTVSTLAEGGWLDHAVADGKHDVRSICLIREALARHAGLADFAFALQGLGSAPIALFGSDKLKKQYLKPTRAGQKIAAFAISEKDAGSDVAALSTTARPKGDFYVLNGAKTWISNGGIADYYVVFARTGEAPGAKGLSAFLVDADTRGLKIKERLEVIAPHPLATITFTDCMVPKTHLLGKPGEGFKIAMSTLDIFRPSVGAAALGFARRALDEALNFTASRNLFGAPLADMQLTQAKLAKMATAIDASALLVYRAAWAKDSGQERITREAAMAKLHATESAQQVIDDAVQMFGALGVKKGSVVEELYREIRALRIYEGASEVLMQVIAKQLLA